MNNSPSEIQDFLPLTETTFYLLLSIASKSRHGYAILKDIQQLSSGRIILSTGTLYGAIKRLVEQKWIERVDNSLIIENGRPIKEYQLTDLGEQIFKAEYNRLKNLVYSAQNRISGENV